MQPDASTHGLETLDWLLDHHETKRRERQMMIQDLKIRPGDHLLDLGCGPGLWTASFMERVAPDGKVVGIDLDANYIKYARARNQDNVHANRITFDVADFNQIPYEDDTFDVVFCGNCFQFVKDHDALFKEIKRVTRPGGRIAEKSFDGSLMVLHPMDTVLLHRVLTATARSLAENPVCPPFNLYFDNYVGRKNRGLFRQAGLADLETHAYAIHKYYPLSGAERRYIAGNARWYLDIGRDFLTREERDAWADCFDPTKPSYIMDSEDFYFCMVEIMTIGTLTSSPR